MTVTGIAPFDSIEAAQEYLTLLSSTVIENKANIAIQIQQHPHGTSNRYIEVLEIVAFNLEQLENHLRTSRKALSNLRKLRALLLEGGPVESHCAVAAPKTTCSRSNFQNEEHQENEAR